MSHGGALAPDESASAARRSRGVVSLRWIATGLAVVLTVVGVLAVGVLSEGNTRKALRREIEARLRLQGRNLALSSSSALLEEYPELTLHPLVRSMRTQQPELELAVVVDHLGMIQGHADPRMLGTRFVPPPGIAGVGDGEARSNEAILRPSGALLVARTPVVHPDGRVIGATYVGLPLAYIDGVLRDSRRQQLLLLGTLVLLGAAAASLLMSQLLRPIQALREGLDRIGRGDLDSPIRVRDRTELGLLAQTVNDMSAALKRAQAEMIERERLAHEVELAREIQRSLLPAETVTAGTFEIRGDQRAAAEVGGDYWDVLPLPDGRLGLAVADVSGKGLAGCLVMSMLSALLRALRTTETSPAALLTALDQRLCESLRPGVFVTMCYAVLDPATGRLTFASAGHNPWIVWRRRTGRVETRASRGIPIGAVRGGAIRATLRDESMQLETGDVCVQFTDGYSEAFARDCGELFGLERLEAIVAAHASRGGEAVLLALRAAIREWSGDGVSSDDETLLVVTCQAAAPRFDASTPVETSDEIELRSALEHLGRAERAGGGLVIRARLEELAALDGWVRALPDLAALSPARREVVRAALYEACANIVEHGCNGDGRSELEVWWLPGPPIGRLVIRDHGRPFRPAPDRSTDFGDPAVRTRGRGLGLEIIHRAAAEVTYHPATPRGNVTILALGPDAPRSEEEVAA
jgi:serine phosphatase RsbU (regulator of sigma subunit)/anti-sigma regulatory factor (Ser/Thr protein kinase)